MTNDRADRIHRTNNAHRADTITNTDHASSSESAEKTAASRVWLITGASSGLGRALATAALESGERVVGTARDLSRFADLRQAYPDTLCTIAHDVRDTDRAADVVTEAISRFGRIDVLVNNAGVGQVGTAEEVDDAALRDMLAQHLFGPAAYVRAVLPHLRAARSGTIVQISSQGGRRSFPAVGSYSAGKFALEGWSEALALEVQPFGIDVLIVEPSRLRTEFNRAGVLLQATERTEYDDVAGAVRADMRGSDGLQEGDPARAAAVIRQVIAAQHPPLRLPLGAEAVRTLSTAYRTALDDVEAWAKVSESADFPGQTHTQARPI
ncbi:SDR family NAD(P)-dependent oxidoreductase [Pseudoclavibacter sp. CFCC 11306]|uniref:SDR family NAD(P)-dependent oxidoreductase n=1 Tax=Pseudoclavibacter sp. CFCC 11306 TaxID=1564493 RepID=UPI0013010E8F|nr:SDR family NAD(P)-dependent oxidoreductase [Pseudoclavibacter sp. CFCC 11306]KAB1658546.1 SDR family NAD(P)-dependent oxidoreductase [Pseudoclavibacter sp. CFCC 11306]